MSMERRVGFTLTELQIAQACVAYVAERLRSDEAATAKLSKEGDVIVCQIAVAKKRVRKKNGAQA